MSVGTTRDSEQVTTLFVALEHLREGLGLPGPNRGTGGIETQIGLLLRHLAARSDYNVVVITNEPFEFPSIQVRVYPPPQKPLSIPVRALRKLGLKYPKRSDPNPRFNYVTDLPGPKVALFPKSMTADEIAAAKQAGCRTMFWVAADSVVDDTPLNKSMPWVQLIRQLLSEVDLVAVLTDHQKDIVARSFGLEATVITGGVELPQCADDQASRTYALWVGRPVPLKRPWLFVELARMYPHRSFRMVLRRPPVDSKMIPYLEYEASRLSNLELVFDVNPSEMAAQYAGAVALVSTSVSEGLSRVMLEAGAAGTQVLSQEIDVDGMLSSGEWGFCAEGDFETLSRKLDELFNSNGGSEEDRARAKNYVAGRYGVHRMVDQFDSAVARLIGGR